jgi:hypothetical protein
MARRTYSSNLYCTEAKSGCRENSFFEATSRREYMERVQSYAKHPGRCLRHMRPGEVVSAEDPERTTTFVSRDGYWHDVDTERKLSISGTGPGFKAFAKDFPEGTRLTVSARVELPAGPSQQEGEDG